MEVKATVVNVELDIEIEKKDGGVYPGSRLTYRGQDGKIADQAFHNNTFKFNAPLKKTLASLKHGESIVIVKEKKGEYWNVVDIRKGDTSQAVISNSPTSSPAPKSGGAWETPEERAKKQLYIVRQSSLSTAVELLASNGGKKNTPEEVIVAAEKFVKYVMSGIQLEGVEALIEMEDDVPA